MSRRRPSDSQKYKGMDIEFICSDCGQRYFVPGDLLSATPNCPRCRGGSTKLTKFVSQSVSRRQIGPLDVGVEDLRDLMSQAFAPVVDRPRTFSEWLTGHDVRQVQLAQKAAATEQVTAMVRQRTTLAKELHSMAMATQTLQDVQDAADQARLKSQVDGLRLEAERLELEEKIDRRLALRERRIRTEQLEEDQKQLTIRAALLPAPAEPDPTTKAIAAERRRLRAGALGRQALIADCLKQVRKIYRSRKLAAEERALRIRAALDAYGLEPLDTPIEIQKFLIAVAEAEHV